MQWDYGDADRGPSHEFTNLYDSLRRMPGVEVAFFDFMAVHQTSGATGVRRSLLDAVENTRPDLLFTVLFEDEVPRDVLAELRDRPRPFTFNWFCDDHWRFESFTSRYAPLFNACSTTAASALPKYRAAGLHHVVKTQWGANVRAYHPTRAPEAHDVTFVGQPHGNRRPIVEGLQAAGFFVETWGHGWEAGRLTQEEMVHVFGTSRINLNLANASWAPGVKGKLRRWLGLSPKLSDQIKGRNFEIPACGGFQLSGHADGLDQYYEPGEEIVVFDDPTELPDLINRYLEDDQERRRIARAGYERTVAEHSYEQRFSEIFREIGLW